MTVPLVLDRVGAEELLDFQRKHQFGSFEIQFSNGSIVFWQSRVTGPRKVPFPND